MPYRLWHAVFNLECHLRLPQVSKTKLELEKAAAAIRADQDGTEITEKTYHSYVEIMNRRKEIFGLLTNPETGHLEAAITAVKEKQAGPGGGSSSTAPNYEEVIEDFTELVHVSKISERWRPGILGAPTKEELMKHMKAASHSKKKLMVALKEISNSARNVVSSIQKHINRTRSELAATAKAKAQQQLKPESGISPKAPEAAAAVNLDSAAEPAIYAMFFRFPAAREYSLQSSEIDKAVEELTKHFEETAFDPSEPLVISCSPLLTAMCEDPQYKETMSSFLSDFLTSSIVQPGAPGQVIMIGQTTQIHSLLKVLT